MPGYPIPQSDGQPPAGSSPFMPPMGPKSGGEINISRSEAMALRAFDTDDDEARATKRAQAESGLSPEQLKTLRDRADRARSKGYTLKGPGIVFKPKQDPTNDEPGLLGRSDFDKKPGKGASKEEGSRFSKQSDKDPRLARAYDKIVSKSVPAKDAKKTRESRLCECGADGTCETCARRVKRARVRERFARLRRR